MKTLLKNIKTGIEIAMVIFCLSGVVFDIYFKGTVFMQNYSYTKMVVGCIVIGIGFGAPAIVYEKESLPRIMQILIHMGIGSVIYTIVAFMVGWIPTQYGIGQCVITVIVQILISFIIWYLFSLYYKKKALKMNQRIQELKK